MATASPHWKIELSQANGVDVAAAMQNYFLGMDLAVEINAIGQAQLHFYDTANGILSRDGVPPLDLSIQDQDGRAIFHGTAMALQRHPDRGRQVTLIYHDPASLSLGHQASYTYASGTLDKIIKQLTQGMQMKFTVDAKLDLVLPAGGGVMQSCFQLICALANSVGAYVIYDPRSEQMQVAPLAAGKTQKLAVEHVIGVSQRRDRADLALHQVNIAARQGLSNQWQSARIGNQDASIRPGAMGGVMGAWARQQSQLHSTSLLISNQTSADAHKYGVQLLNSQIMRAGQMHINVIDHYYYPGDTVMLPVAHDMFDGELLLCKAHYHYGSRATGNLTGVMA